METLLTECVKKVENEYHFNFRKRWEYIDPFERDCCFVGGIGLWLFENLSEVNRGGITLSEDFDHDAALAIEAYKYSIEGPGCWEDGDGIGFVKGLVIKLEELGYDFSELHNCPIPNCSEVKVKGWQGNVIEVCEHLFEEHSHRDLTLLEIAEWGNARLVKGEK